MELGVGKAFVIFCFCALCFFAGYLAGAQPQDATKRKQSGPRVQGWRMQDRFIGNLELLKLEGDAKEADGWADASRLTAQTLPKRREDIGRLGGARLKVLEQIRSGVGDGHYIRAAAAVDLLRKAATEQDKSIDALLLYAAGGIDTGGGDTAPGPSNSSSADGDFVIKVEERPFGMHLHPGSTEIGEIFPGFPAHRLGLKEGCKVLEIAGKEALAGTWIRAFQSLPLPFDLRLNCQKKEQVVSEAASGATLKTQDPAEYRVMVTKKPFGMNVQVNVLPRVVEVLPGYPAEAAGVRTGFVLTKVADKPVDATTWFTAMQASAVPFVLTFDTTVPLHVGNPFIAEANNGGAAKMNQQWTGDPYPDSEYEDFRCEVDQLPFGMGMSAPIGGPLTVEHVVKGRPADKKGVHEGDILLEVAGRPVNSTTWFAAMQESTPPFGLRLRRRRQT